MFPVRVMFGDEPLEDQHEETRFLSRVPEVGQPVLVRIGHRNGQDILDHFICAAIQDKTDRSVYVLVRPEDE